MRQACEDMRARDDYAWRYRSPGFEVACEDNRIATGSSHLRHDIVDEMVTENENGIDVGVDRSHRGRKMANYRNDREASSEDRLS